jgi:hypothetical protein
MMLTETEAILVYNVLIALAGAPVNMKENFIYHHTKPDGPEEWRFGGKLGFGGKYWSRRNLVSCYSEDETTEREDIIKLTNTALTKAKDITA